MTPPSFLFGIFFYWQWTIFVMVLFGMHLFFFNAKHKGNVANQLPKNTFKFFIFGNVSSNFFTTFGPATFSFFILPLYRKKSYIIPDDSALTKFLKLHRFGFLGLYWQILLYFVLAGIIRSSMECSLSGAVKMQLFQWSITGWILNNLLLIFSSFSFSKLSLKCKNSLNFWYLFRDMMSAIIGYLFH